jgi:CBS domain-containing protein
MHINDVLQAKGDAGSESVVTISPDATVRELVTLLAENNIGAVVVSTGDEPVAGIVSERDIVRGLVEGVDVLDASISQIMTTQVRTVKPDESVHDLMRLMSEHRVRHVPVVADQALLGIVSIGDVVKSRIEELEFERDQLSSYVSHTQ